MTNSATIAARYTPSVLRLRCYSPRLLTTGSQEAPAGSLLTCAFRISPRMRLPPLGEISFLSRERHSERAYHNALYYSPIPHTRTRRGK